MTCRSRINRRYFPLCPPPMVIGGLLLGIVPNAVLLPALTVILLLSATKVWRHR